MAYTLAVDHPDFEKGYEFDCDGILIKNGETLELTKEDELAFIARLGRDAKDIYGHGTIAKLTGSSSLSKKEKAEALPPEPEAEAEEPAPEGEEEPEPEAEEGGE